MTSQFCPFGDKTSAGAPADAFMYRSLHPQPSKPNGAEPTAMSVYSPTFMPLSLQIFCTFSIWFSVSNCK